MYMDDSNNPFRKAGIVLLIIGIIDIGVMVYCIANKINYSSSFNIFAFIAGIFLMKRGVKTARAVRWFSVFLTVGFVGLFLTLPLTTPIDLLITQVKLNTLSILASIALGLIPVALLIWVHLQLSTPESLNILAKSGYKTGKPISAYIIGFLFIVLLTGINISFTNGDSAQKAKNLAQEQLGSEYQYHVSSISVSGDSGSALVIAFTDKEIRNIPVRW